MHILWVSQWFPPDLGALPARITEMSEAWLAAGHEVTVVTAVPHHPTGKVPPAYRRRLVVEERYGGIRVVRCWLLARPNRRAWERVLTQASFGATSVALALGRPRRPEVVIVSSPPFFCSPAGVAFAAYHRVPLVFEVRDLWPAVFVATGAMTEGLLYRGLERMELWLYRRAHSIVVVTESFREDLIARGVPAGKIAVIPNGADLGRFRPVPAAPDLRLSLGGEGRFLVVYAGTHGVATGLEQLLDAAERLQGETAIHFALVGEGARRQALIDEAARRGLTNVTFAPPVTKARMAELYATADVCVVCLAAVPLLAKFVPSKLFEILACGRPVVAAVAGEAAAIAEAAGAVVVAPGSGRSLADAVLSLHRDSARRSHAAETARPFVASRYDRRDLAARYAQLLEDLRAAGR